MEDDLKILKVESLSNHLLDHTQILNLSLEDQTKFNKCPQSWHLSLDYQTIYIKSLACLSIYLNVLILPPISGDLNK